MIDKIERDWETQFNLVVAEKDALEAQVAELTNERNHLQSLTVVNENLPVPALRRQIAALEQQRDELLAALCEVSVSARLGVTKMTPELLLFIDAAIAKVKP